MVLAARRRPGDGAVLREPPHARAAADPAARRTVAVLVGVGHGGVDHGWRGADYPPERCADGALHRSGVRARASTTSGGEARNSPQWQGGTGRAAARNKTPAVGAHRETLGGPRRRHRRLPALRPTPAGRTGPEPSCAAFGREPRSDLAGRHTMARPVPEAAPGTSRPAPPDGTCPGPGPPGGRTHCDRTHRVGHRDGPDAGACADVGGRRLVGVGLEGPADRVVGDDKLDDLHRSAPGTSGAVRSTQLPRLTCALWWSPLPIRSTNRGRSPRRRSRRRPRAGPRRRRRAGNGRAVRRTCGRRT